MMKNNSNENIHKDHRKRMRERFKATGFKGWSKNEILEYMLYNVYRQADTNEIAHRILKYNVGSFVNMFKNTYDRRMENDIPNVGESTILFLRCLKEFIDAYRREELLSEPIKAEPENLIEISRIADFSPDRETLIMICIDGLMNIKNIVNITEASDATYAVSSAEKIVRSATMSCAKKVILMHNHPDGSASVSQEDIAMTMQVDRLLSQLGIELIDHLVMSGNEFVSVKVECFKMYMDEKEEV